MGGSYRRRQPLENENPAYMHILAVADQDHESRPVPKPDPPRPVPGPVPGPGLEVRPAGVSGSEGETRAQGCRRTALPSA